MDLHCDAAGLLVFARVEVADLACELGGDDAVGGEEAVGEGCLAVVDVREDADVADVVRALLQAHNLRRRDDRHRLLLMLIVRDDQLKAKIEKTNFESRSLQGYLQALRDLL